MSAVFAQTKGAVFHNMDNISIELLRKNMDTVILKSLYDNSKYGLEIYNDIKSTSQALYSVKQATMYKTLKKMEDEGLIISSPGEESNGAKRVYFSLSELGRQQVTKTMKEWEFSRTILDKLVSDKVFDPELQDAPFDVAKLRPKTKRTRHTDNSEDEIIIDEDDEQYSIDDINDEDQRKSVIFESNIEDNVIENINHNINNNSDTNKIISNLADPYHIIEQNSIISNNSNHVKDIESQSKTYKSDSAKIVLDDKFIFTDRISEELLNKSRQPNINVNNNEYISNYDINKVSGNFNSANNQNDAMFTLFSKDYEPIKTVDYTNSKTVTKNVSYVKQQDNSNTFEFTHNIPPSLHTRSNEEIKSAAQKLYDKNYNLQNDHSVKSDNDIMQFTTVIKAKDPLSINDKNKIFKDFMNTPSDNTDVTATTPPLLINRNDNLPHSDISKIPYEDVSPTKRSCEVADNNTSSRKVIATKASNNQYETINYINSFDNIFNSNIEEENSSNNTQTNEIIREDNEEMSFGRLKSKLAADNIKLKQYIKSNTSNYYVGRFFYSNRLLRDWSLISFAIYAVYALAMYFITKSVVGSASTAGIIIACLIGFILPLGTTIVWFMDKTKRKRNNYNFIQSIISSAIVMMIALLIVILVAFLGFKVNFSDIKTYFESLIIPLIALLQIPLSVVIYNVLYNSKFYHIK